jgi:rRNA maturation endonuclease Nob1
MVNPKKHKVKCHCCFYIWKTNSILLRVTCPDCGNKTKNKTYRSDKNV